MFTKEEIAALAGDMESERVERTISTSNTDKFGQAICAFSNDLYNRKQNGLLLVGVDDKTGALSGLKVTDELLRNIGAIRSDGNILPQPAMYVYHYPYDAGDILVVEVEPAHFPPVRYKGQISINRDSGLRTHSSHPRLSQ